ncbi:hypothetical protein QTJ16_001416 [Diplocarpon rosae]|uniref:Mitochondrial K+-H+ exchange-related-domain-containing protein n=1 Tax=Diplocarpon rosae TaxID=946125 RepID=A0AAD9T7E2_9HELO|nr:hypothetical protein QTJ16_001416 [Diplocarpon rosae]PBP22296.1 hypothetical protein BUE80_DR006866 [Diplocarpon rosae]
MRLFLLPISTRRTLIYCQRLNVTGVEQQGWLDKGTVKAAALWARWEQKDSGWQKKVVDYGNEALKRIPYEEWALKSIPPLSARRKAEGLAGKGTVEVSFPATMIPPETVTEVLGKLGAERQTLHKTRMVYSFIGMPISAPFALIPVVPNIPFFYLVYRAWSHWRALSGSKHIEFLLDKNLIRVTPSKILDDLYAEGNLPHDAAREKSSEKSSTTTNDVDVDEKMVLHKSNTQNIAEALGIPELDIELDRAVWQVERALREKQELVEEERNLKAATSKRKKKN